MTRNVCPLALAAAALFFISTRDCQADPISSVAPYNVFIFGNANQSGTDVGGRIAVGGNAVFSNYGVASALPDIFSGNPAIPSSLIVGGNLTYTNGQVFRDSVYVGGTATLNGVGIPNGSLFNPASPINFAAAQSGLTSQSQLLSTLPPNGTSGSSFGAITLTGSNPNLNVFGVAGSALAAATMLTINAPPGSTVLINVDGTTDQLANFAMVLNGVDKTHVLFNFFDATSLDVSGISVQGSILAPFAVLNFNNSNIEGNTIVDSLNGNGEFHNFPFQGHFDPLTPFAIPEPSSLALCGLTALIGLGVWRRRAVMLN
jgi:choice-of-anchor A domain-containing protein